MKDFVSILVPAYNAGKFIAKTIQSAIDQTWPNKEITVVDDGSRDDTFRIAKSFESGNLKVFRQDNTGACGARNKAFELCQGDFIQWLDADDLMEPDKISRQLQSIGDDERSRLVYTSSWGKFYSRTKTVKFVKDSLWQDLEPVEWIIRKFSDNVWMNPTVWLMSRELTALAGPWDERLTMSGVDDGEYICRVVAASRGVKFMPEAKAYYRIGNPASLNSGMGKSRKKLESLLLSLKISIQHLLNLEDSPRSRAACVRHLQTWLPFFYRKEDNLVKEINTMAHLLPSAQGHCL